MIEEGGEMDRIEADGGKMCCISNIFLYSKGNVNYAKNRIYFLKKKLSEKDDTLPHFENVLIIVSMDPTLYTRIAHPTAKPEPGRECVCKHTVL